MALSKKARKASNKSIQKDFKRSEIPRIERWCYGYPWGSLRNM